MSRLWGSYICRYRVVEAGYDAAGFQPYFFSRCRAILI
jgi:hypothetical protein